MNNAKMWLVVKPTVGIPLFLSAVAVGSFAVHVAVLSNTTWVADFLSGQPLGAGATAALPLPADGGSYPFAEVVSASAPSHRLLTVCTACPARENHGALTLQRTTAGWQITGTNRGLKVDVSLDFSVAAPPAVRAHLLSRL